LCNQCPALIRVKDDRGCNPLHLAVRVSYRDFSLERVKIFCDLSGTFVRDQSSMDEGSYDHTF
jgi:hypothetical protein